jgi:hypothetical protein
MTWTQLAFFFKLYQDFYEGEGAGAKVWQDFKNGDEPSSEILQDND